MDLSSEKVGGRKRPVKGVMRDNVRVKRVLGDGAFDPKANFNFLAQEGIIPVIRVRKVPRPGMSLSNYEARRHRIADLQAEGMVKN